MKFKNIILLLVVFSLIYLSLRTENFWPLEYSSGWYGENKNLYFHEISGGIITRLDDKINLYEIIKDESYCPKSFLEKDNFSSNSNDVWFIKQRGAGGASLVIPSFFNDIKNKLQTVRKLDIGGEHKSAYREDSNYIIQKEIIPFLIDEKKNDLRIFYLVVFYEGILYFYLSKDAIVKISGEKYKRNCIDRSKQITNNYFSGNYHNNKLLSDTKDYNICLNKLTYLFHKLSNKLVPLFKNFKSNKLEYQICGADVIFDNLLNPYLLELNSGWPCYIHQSNTADIKKYKTNVLLDIARITKGFLTKSEINLVNLFELKKVNVTNI